MSGEGENSNNVGSCAYSRTKYDPYGSVSGWWDLRMGRKGEAATAAFSLSLSCRRRVVPSIGEAPFSSATPTRAAPQVRAVDRRRGGRGGDSDGTRLVLATRLSRSLHCSLPGPEMSGGRGGDIDVDRTSTAADAATMEATRPLRIFEYASLGPERTDLFGNGVAGKTMPSRRDGTEAARGWRRRKQRRRRRERPRMRLRLPRWALSPKRTRRQPRARGDFAPPPSLLMLLLVGLAASPSSRLLQPIGVGAQSTGGGRGGGKGGVNFVEPVDELTEAPVKESTEAPVEESTEEPVKESTEAPVSAVTALPTVAPSVAVEPPTAVPMATPTDSPTAIPTTVPTTVPTAAPTTTRPTLLERSEILGRYQQDLEVVADSNIFDETEQDIFELLMESYTQEYGPGMESGMRAELINTTCKISAQSILGGLQPTPLPTKRASSIAESQIEPTEEPGGGGTDRWLRGVGEKDQDVIDLALAQRALQAAAPQLRLGYEIFWASDHIEVGPYVDGFATFINSNLERVAEDIRNAGLVQVSKALTVFPVRTTPQPTPPPTTQNPTLVPTALPSLSPTISFNPTPVPSPAPTVGPTGDPSVSPSAEPSRLVESVVVSVYEQDLDIVVDSRFDEEETLKFQEVMEGYTLQYGPRVDKDSLRVSTVCEVLSQRVLGARMLSSFGMNLQYARHFTSFQGALLHPSAVVGDAHRHKRLQEQTLWKLRLLYRMTWASNYTDVMSYSNDFANFISSDLSAVTDDLNNAGLEQVESTYQVFQQRPTPSPTQSPTLPTTLTPTVGPSHPPTARSTSSPTLDPTFEATSSFPTVEPTQTPIFSTPAPSNLSDVSGSGLNLGAILGMAAGGATLLALFVVWLCRRRSKNKDSAFNRPPGRKPHPQTTARSVGGPGGSVSRGPRQPTHLMNDHDRVDVDVAMEQSGGMVIGGGPMGMPASAVAAGNMYKYQNGHEFSFVHEDEVHDVDQIIPQDDSLVSNQSLISAGMSMSSDSGHEDDARDFLADEFDQIKDQNLEKMRTEVEGTVTNVDGMMSQALLKALMDDEETNRDMNELTWGGSRSSIEIEASVLCEMNDWLKRKEGAGLDERRAFMQDTLNKMVASVRHGIVEPEEASRTIHECAAMLGLQLAENIPETALIVTGMRKTVGTQEMIMSFKEFGDIENAAVSPNQRGFGLVRYRSPKSVLRAIDRFKTAEIVVQDVAVMIRVLKSEGGSVPYSSSNRQPVQTDAARSAPTPAPARGTGGMEAHHGPNLETIGYPGGAVGYQVDSFGAPPGAVVAGRGYSRAASDAGSGRSGRSRTSKGSRSQNQQHSRKGSGGSNAGSNRGSRSSRNGTG